MRASRVPVGRVAQAGLAGVWAVGDQYVRTVPRHMHVIGGDVNDPLNRAAASALHQERMTSQAYMGRFGD